LEIGAASYAVDVEHFAFKAEPRTEAAFYCFDIDLVGTALRCRFLPVGPRIARVEQPMHRELGGVYAVGL